MSAGRVRRRRWIHQGVKREAWGFTVTTPEGRVRKSGYATRGEAQEALDALKRPAPVVEPVAPAGPTLTFKAVLDRYYLLRARKKSIREDRRIGAVLLARFGDVPLAEISAAKISEYKAERLAVTNSRLGAPPSVASINRPLAMLRSVLRVVCREWEVLPSVPHIKLEREPQGRLRWLDEPEATRLLAACRAHPDLADLVEFALFTGMRQGELLGLTLESRGPRPRGGAAGGDEVREAPRGAAERRRGRRARPPAGVRGHGRARVPSPLGRLPPGVEEGGRGRQAGRVQVPRPAPHVRLVGDAAGATLPVLQALLGHASLTMTMRYAHLAPEHLRAAVGLLDGAMALPARAQEIAENGTTALEP